MNLQSLFPSPILEQQYLDRDYSGFGNDVWIVRTKDEHAVVRVSAREGVGGASWTGVARLFGVDGTSMDDLRVINDTVSETTGFRAPRVLRTGMVDGRAYAVTELLPGRHVESFDDVAPAAAEAFGSALARAHRRTFDFCGSPAGRSAYPVVEFHQRAADIIESHARRYRHNARDLTIAGEAAARLRAPPPPVTSSLILFDIGGSQYLWDDDGPTGVVDTEVYVYAPRELELTVLSPTTRSRSPPRSGAYTSRFRRCLTSRPTASPTDA